MHNSLVGLPCAIYLSPDHKLAEIKTMNAISDIGSDIAFRLIEDQSIRSRIGREEMFALFTRLNAALAPISAARNSERNDLGSLVTLPAEASH